MARYLETTVSPNGGVQLLFPGETRLFEVQLIPIHERTISLFIEAVGEYGSSRRVRADFGIIVEKTSLTKQEKLLEIAVNDEVTEQFYVVNGTNKQLNYAVA